MTDAVVDDAPHHRLGVRGEGGDAELVYERSGSDLVLIHTEVPAAFRGRGTGGHLVEAAIALARAEGLTIVPWCPFARRWLHEHPDAAGDVAIDWEREPPESDS